MCMVSEDDGDWMIAVLILSVWTYWMVTNVCVGKASLEMELIVMVGFCNWYIKSHKCSGHNGFSGHNGSVGVVDFPAPTPN